MGLKHKGGKWKPLLVFHCHQTRKKFMPQVVSAGHVAAGCERRFCLYFRGDEWGMDWESAEQRVKTQWAHWGKAGGAGGGKGHHGGGMVLIMVVPKTQEPFLSAQMTGYSRD